MKQPVRAVLMILPTIMLVSCSNSDMVRPSQKIGPMWVNRYGHSNAQFIWDFCEDSMTDEPGIRTTECNVPWVDELFIGYGIRGLDKSQRDALWEARTWELSVDGYPVDLPAFNILDFDAEQDGKTFEYRIWRIRLREITEGFHTLRYVMHVNQEVEGDPSAQSPGTYELVINFTFGSKP